jgi:predicted Zn-dependent protease
VLKQNVILKDLALKNVLKADDERAAIGVIGKENILKELGTGLYLSNLHYLNWSDRLNARITGMTRYACFWVENGEIVAPIADLRFDENLYDCLGENLLAVTDFQEVDPNVSTYDSRGFGGKKLPGLLIKDFKFTL